MAPHETIEVVRRSATVVETPSSDGRVTWRIWGEGAPLILLHGGHGSWRHWILNIPALSETHRVIVPDLPGMGDSDPVGDGTGIEPIAKALVDGIERLGIDSLYALAGFSFGSILSGHILAHHVDRISHLILVGASRLCANNADRPTLRRWKDELDPLRRTAVHRHNLEVLMLHDASRIDDLAIAVHAHNTEHTRRYTRHAAMATDLREYLVSRPVPMTAIWGEEDVFLKQCLRESVDFVSRLKPAGLTFVVPGAGHWVQYEAAALVNACILESLK